MLLPPCSHTTGRTVPYPAVPVYLAKVICGKKGVDLKPYLAGGNEALRKILRQIVTDKPDRHQLLSSRPSHNWVAMSQIGG